MNHHKNLSHNMFRTEDPILYKLQQELAAQGPVDAEFLRQVSEMFPTGTKVKVDYTTHIGEVVGTNDDQGFYHGNRLPVLVKITESSMPEAINHIFPYAIDNLTILPR